MDEQNRIVDGVKRFFIMLPMMIDDMELTPQAVRLYIHIVRRAGDESGGCWESTRNMAKACRMSVGSISTVKKELLKAGLIKIDSIPRAHGEFPYHRITTVNIWRENIDKYSPVHTVNRSGTPDDTKEYPKSLSGSTKKEKSDAPMRVPQLSSNDDKLQRAHPAIRAIKLVTGYYPPKNLYGRIIEFLGEAPNIPSLQVTFDTWTANGYNPRKLMGWLFGWHAEEMHYVPKADKFQEK